MLSPVFKIVVLVQKGCKKGKVHDPREILDISVSISSRRTTIHYVFTYKRVEVHWVISHVKISRHVTFDLLSICRGKPEQMTFSIRIDLGLEVLQSRESFFVLPVRGREGEQLFKVLEGICVCFYFLLLLDTKGYYTFYSIYTFTTFL